VVPRQPIVAIPPSRPSSAGKAIFTSSAHRATAVTPPSMKITVEVSPELDAMLNNMAEELEESKATTVLRAIALLRTALETKDKGERLIIVNDHDNTECELEF
jgi:hypothetical protein